MPAYLLDVNVLVQAQRAEMPQHHVAKAWICASVNRRNIILYHEPVLASCLRIITNKKIFKTPTPLGEALEFIEDLLNAPTANLASPPPECWAEIKRLSTHGSFVGDDISDVYLAALAISLGAVFVTFDKGFSRFPALRLQEPVLPPGQIDAL